MNKNQSNEKYYDASVGSGSFKIDQDTKIKLDISDLKKFNSNTGIYIAGHTYGHDDQLPRFFNSSVWETGSKSKYSKLINNVQAGALIISKTKSIKGSILYIDGYGIVTENPRDGKSLRVNWSKRLKKPYRFEGLAASYPGTLHKIQNRHIEIITNKIGPSIFYDIQELQIGKESHQNYSGLQIQPDSAEVYLNAEIIAEEFGDIIHRSKKVTDTSKPSQEDRFYGIFGKWGRGKTRFWNLLRGHLQNNYKDQYYFIDFHAWKYQDTPAVWAYLYEKFASEYYISFKCFWKYPIQKVANLFQSFWLTTYRNPNLIFLFIISFIIFFFTLTLQLNNDIWKIVLPLLPAVSFVYTIYKSFSKPLASTANKFIKLTARKSFSGHLGLQHEMQEELAILLRAWSWWFPKNSKKTFVLFIDDIDRCEEKKVVQIVDSIRVMLNEPEIQKRLIVVAAIDERILSQAIRKKYEGFVGETNTVLDLGKLTAEYIDKLFIAGIKLSELTKEDKKAIFLGYSTPLVERENVEESPIENKDSSQEEPLSKNELEDEQRNTSNLENKKQIQQADFELTQEEVVLLSKMIEDLNNATPRSIRGFLIKYRLCRNLAYKLLEKSDEDRDKYIANRLLSVMNFEQPYNYNDENTFEQITQIISMVDYYYYNNTVDA